MSGGRRPGGPTKRQIAASLAFYGGAPMPTPAPKRQQARPEAEVLADVLGALRRHPAVAWVERVNSGVVQVDGRWIRYGWVGASDVLGQLRDGRLLAVECKSATGRTSEAQDEFLARVLAAGGVAFVARSVDDVAAALALAAADPRHEPLQPSKPARTADDPSDPPIARQRPASQAGGGSASTDAGATDRCGSNLAETGVDSRFGAETPSPGVSAPDAAAPAVCGDASQTITEPHQ